MKIIFKTNSSAFGVKLHFSFSIKSSSSFVPEVIFYIQQIYKLNIILDIITQMYHTYIYLYIYVWVFIKRKHLKLIIIN